MISAHSSIGSIIYYLASRLGAKDAQENVAFLLGRHRRRALRVGRITPVSRPSVVQDTIISQSITSREPGSFFGLAGATFTGNAGPAAISGRLWEIMCSLSAWFWLMFRRNRSGMLVGPFSATESTAYAINGQSSTLRDSERPRKATDRQEGARLLGEQFSIRRLWHTVGGRGFQSQGAGLWRAFATRNKRPNNDDGF